MDSPFKLDFWRWANFAPVEVLSKAGMSQFLVGNLMIQVCALDFLQAFRDKVKLPIVCNTATMPRRGYRSQNENQDVGGCLLGRHTQGIAFDISCAALSLDEFYRAAIEFGWGGIGIYPSRNFIHVDCRAILNGKQITWMR
jgi:zinc D-Ala-D-Ala carboxypeptidase